MRLRNQHQPPAASSEDAGTFSSLDHIDRSVVAALQADGRRTFSSIAEQLGVAESVVRYRTQRMERAGILQVVGIADPLKLGFDLMALVGLRVTPGSLGDVCAAVAKVPETSYVAAVAGQYDVFVELVCRDTAHFQEVLVGALQSVVGVQSTESFLILEIHKMAYGWGAGESGVPVADKPAIPSRRARRGTSTR
ncbi:MAG TPA: Lrp/AsnC family transcriptional regulator [Desertimonas sp.]|nr:Lrp/AsnC family transcriptional regulator [Desertimonas sp.]